MVGTGFIKCLVGQLTEEPVKQKALEDLGEEEIALGTQ